MAYSKSTLAQRNVRPGETTASLRVERGGYGSNDRHHWYKATGSRGELIASGLAISDWFPQGRKRMADGGNFGLVNGKCQMSWRIKRCAGDCFELTIWNATDEQLNLLAPMLPVEPIVPPTPEEVARKQADAVECWGHMIEATWRMASKGETFRLAERDRGRFLEALRAARAILNTATIVNVEQQQSALGVARQDQTFQQFMLEQGLRGHAAEDRAP